MKIEINGNEIELSNFTVVVKGERDEIEKMVNETIETIFQSNSLVRLVTSSSVYAKVDTKHPLYFKKILFEDISLR